MSLSTAEIQTVVKDLAPKLEGGKIVRIDQPDRWRLILHVHNDGRRYWLQFVLHPRFSRLHLLTRRPDEEPPAGGLCNVARQHLTGAPVRALRQVEGDRVVVLESTERDALMETCEVSLVAELVGTGSNLILLDAEGMILGSAFTEDSSRRQIAPGQPYSPLPPPPKGLEKARRNRFADAAEPDDELALHRAIQKVYREAETEAELDEKRKALLARAGNHLERLRSRIRKLQGDLDAAENAGEYRRLGELLKIALPHARKGQKEVTVQDWFEPDAPERTIELDPRLTPEENVEKYFQKYKKLQASLEHVEERLEQSRGEITRVEKLIRTAEDVATLEELEALRERVRTESILPPEGRAEPRAETERGGPRTFLSSDGLEILVARNREQNHELTFSISRGNDYWLHLLGWEGPHVIIRKPRGKDVPLETLLDAAHLAVYYSKIRGADYAEVIYTPRKYVRPIKGAGPGRVRYANESRLKVGFEQERLRRLLERGQTVES